MKIWSRLIRSSETRMFSMVSDFFCPNTGGVESHIYYLSQCLLSRGHKVVVLTHAYGSRCGIRYLSNNLKVYYLPFIVFYNGCILPSLFGTLMDVRFVLLTEQIEIVHGHSSFSCLALEAMIHAQLLGLRTVFTDHSLFGFADVSSILTNKLLQCSLANCDSVICVSHTSKENTVLRADLFPERVFVIPNAIDCDMFSPCPSKQDKTKVTVVVISRLVYRKGADLLAALIPTICKRHCDVHFLIAGDGPKRIALEEMRERYQLQERVVLLGAVPHTSVRDILVQGQLFLNTSLTEAFCMAIVEAASCGLHVVSTKVGGIPEVLPSDLISLAEPTVTDLIHTLDRCIVRCKRQGFGNLFKIHARLRDMYTWPDVARRTEVVYERTKRMRRPLLREKLTRFFHCGFVFAFFLILLAVTDYCLILLLNLFRPASKLKRCGDPARDDILERRQQTSTDACQNGYAGAGTRT